jgi:predicted small secreted protein
MKSKVFKFFVFAVCAFILGTTGCRENNTTAKDVGSGIDKKVETAGEKIDSMVDKAGEKVEKTGQKIKDSVK